MKWAVSYRKDDDDEEVYVRNIVELKIEIQPNFVAVVVLRWLVLSLKILHQLPLRYL